MDGILNMLVQEIERVAFPGSYAQPEYRQQQFQVSQHRNWLSKHLSEEERGHLEKAQAAELRVETLEREALIRTALAVGIRLALPS